MRSARWIDLGELPPLRLHAAYAGLAEAQAAGDAPILLWARSARPHLSVGATQSPDVELDLAASRQAGIEVVRRPLGGGTVLVDAWQLALFVILPGARLSPRAFIRRCLEPLVRTYRRFGIAACVAADTDIVVDGVKLSGSGAATVGASLVFGSSFVQRFDHELFCRLIRAPSEGFRDWLRAALRAGFRPWPPSPPWPGELALRTVLRQEVETCLGWRCEDSGLRTAERAAIARAETELRAATTNEDTGRRRVPHGIKINAGTFLFESRDERGWLRILCCDDRIARLAAQDPAVTPRLQPCLGCPPQAVVLTARLAGVLPRSEVDYWARRIETTAHTPEV